MTDDVKAAAARTIQRYEYLGDRPLPESPAHDARLVARAYHAAAERIARLEAALTEITRMVDHEQPLGNGHRLREIARLALVRGETDG